MKQKKIYKEKIKGIESDSMFRYSKSCRQAFDCLTIKSDVVVWCVDYLSTTKCGNIFKNILEEIWNRKELCKFIENSTGE